MHSQTEGSIWEIHQELDTVHHPCTFLMYDVKITLHVKDMLGSSS